MSTQFIEKKSSTALIENLPNAAGVAVVSGDLYVHDGTAPRKVRDAADDVAGEILAGKVLTTPVGVLAALEALFTQTTGDGTYTASFAIPAGAHIYDIIVTNVVTWNAGTSASLKIGINGGDDDCFFTGVNLNSPTIAAGKSIRFGFPGGVGGASVPAIDVGGEGGAAASSAIFLGATSGFLYKATAQQIDAIVAQVGTGANGRTRVQVLYAVPPSVSAAAKV